jgi:NhaP-type Na+/H+ or K+/H+ antiporter
MDQYAFFLGAFGAVVLLTAWVPMLLKKRPISLPMICIAIGFIVAMSPLHPLVNLNPLENLYLTQRMTEFVLIVAMMGAGLKLDRPLSCSFP